MRNEKCKARGRTREQAREVSACATNDWPLISIDARVIIYERLLCAPMTPPTPQHRELSRRQTHSAPRRIFACKQASDAKEQWSCCFLWEICYFRQSAWNSNSRAWSWWRSRGQLALVSACWWGFMIKMHLRKVSAALLQGNFRQHSCAHKFSAV